jgi:hypothetical protein
MSNKNIISNLGYPQNNNPINTSVSLQLSTTPYNIMNNMIATTPVNTMKMVNNSNTTINATTISVSNKGKSIQFATTFPDRLYLVNGTLYPKHLEGKRCIYCSQLITGEPIGPPIQRKVWLRQDGKFYVFVIKDYCNYYECAYSHALSQLSKSMDKQDPVYFNSIQYLKALFAIQYPDKKLEPAPEKELFAEHGGPIIDWQGTPVNWQATPNVIAALGTLLYEVR